MAEHLRFYPEEYQALARAGTPLLQGSSLRTFQRGLVTALRSSQPALAERIAGLEKQEVLLLRRHLSGQRGDHGETDKRPACALSFQEWRTIAQACALILVLDDSVHSFRNNLLREVRESEPRLAAKLARLDQAQIATLYRRVRSGRRWCP